MINSCPQTSCSLSFYKDYYPSPHEGVYVKCVLYHAGRELPKSWTLLGLPPSFPPPPRGLSFQPCTPLPEHRTRPWVSARMPIIPSQGPGPIAPPVVLLWGSLSFCVLPQKHAHFYDDLLGCVLKTKCNKMTQVSSNIAIPKFFPLPPRPHLSPLL